MLHSNVLEVRCVYFLTIPAKCTVTYTGICFPFQTRWAVLIRRSVCLSVAASPAVVTSPTLL